MKFHYCEFKTPIEAKEFFINKHNEGWRILCDIFVTQWKTDVDDAGVVLETPAEYAAVFYTDN